MTGHAFPLVLLAAAVVLGTAAFLLARDDAAVAIGDLAPADEGTVVTLAGTATPEPVDAPATFERPDGFWIRDGTGWALVSGSPIRPELGQEGSARGLVADVVVDDGRTWVLLEQARWRGG